MFLAVPYCSYGSELLNCAKVHMIFKCIEVGFKKKIKFSNTKLAIILLEDTIIITEIIRLKGTDESMKLLMPPIPLTYAVIQGLVIGNIEILQLTLHSSCILTISSNLSGAQEKFLEKFNTLQEQMLNTGITIINSC